MRILLLCNKSPWPPKDGGASATLNIIRSLLAFNASVTVLALNTSKHFVRIEDIPDELINSADYRLINIDSAINHTKLILNLIFSKKPYNLTRFWSSSFNAELKNILKKNFDIIQIEGLTMHMYLRTIRQYSTSPVVFRAHNIENLIWSQLADEEKNPLISLYFRILARRLKKIEKDIINEFDGILPLSLSDLEWFKAEGLLKPCLLSVPGYDPAEIREQASLNPAHVFFIGALDWRPNIYGLNWFIKQVWPVVVKRIPHAKFIIAGRNASKKTIARLKGQNVIFEGEVESSAGFMKNKSVMVVPLFSGSGIRMKIIEGMSLGKCIVTTPVGAKGVVCIDRKNIFIASSPSDFADHIVELLDNSFLNNEAGKNAIENVRENYNIFVSSKNLMNFFRELTA
jgi:polysaccharide biosynthesis protein PslH